MYHYDAFISYNHNPRDMKIAGELQRQLENYRIPRTLQTDEGKSRIERVFLDKGELEVAGDLTEVIRDALDNSDKLIVICSPDSRESIWVKREIDYYLQTHSRNDILTVITEGEPFDVLPETILHDESSDKSYEPLSCDFRSSDRRARSAELPRLAAAMLGCRYDDLVQRQRHYRMRRLMILMSVVAVTLTSSIAYLIWSNHQIRANLNASLREQSLNLAFQSGQALAEGDRINAVRYALDALPSEGNKRPVVPQAVKALADSINLYKTPHTENWSAIRRFKAEGASHSKVATGDFDGRCFVAELFSNGRVAVYDAATGRELMTDVTDSIGSEALNLEFSSDGRLIIVTADRVLVLDPAGEKTLHDIALGNQYSILYSYRTFDSYCDDLAIAGDALWLPLGAFDDAAMKTVYSLTRINLADGSVKDVTDLGSRPSLIRVSEDGRYIAYISTQIYELNADDAPLDPDVLTILDAGTNGTGKVKKTASIERAIITDAGFISNSRLVICGLSEMPTNFDFSQYDHVDISGSGRRTLSSYAHTRTTQISCIDAGAGTSVWDHDYKIRASGLPMLDIRVDEECPQDIFCTTGSHLMMLDKEGRELSQLNAESGICTIGSVRKDFFNAILFNGEIMIYSHAKDEVVTTYGIFPSQLRDAQRTKDYTFITTADRSLSVNTEILTQYSFSGRDPEWEDFAYGEQTADPSGFPDDAFSFVCAEAGGNETFIEIRSAIGSHYKGDDYVAQLLVRSSRDGSVLSNYSVPIHAVLSEQPYEYTSFDYSGIDPDSGTAYFADDQNIDSLDILSVDLSTGEQKTVNVPLRDPADDDTSTYRILSPSIRVILSAGLYDIDGGHLYYAARCRRDDPLTSATKISLVILDVDPVSGEVSKHTVMETDDDSEFFNEFVMNAKSRRLVRLENEAAPDGESGEIKKLVCYDFDGNLIWENRELPEFIVSYGCTDDGTVIAVEPGQTNYRLHFYSAGKGEDAVQTDLGATGVNTSSVVDYVDISEDEFMVSAGRDAFLIDKETYELRTAIADTYIAYDPSGRQFMLGNGDSRETGHVPYRTLDEMIAEGTKLLE